MSSSLSEQSIPLRWPAAWQDARLLDVLKGSPVDCLIDAPAPVAAAARARGLAAISRDEAASAVQFLSDAQWPGVRAGRKSDAADAGPTAAAWVNANGYSIRLAQALNPGKPVWVEAAPEKGTVQTDASYLLAIAESAVYAARSVLVLDDGFAKGLAEGDAAMRSRWQKMMSAARFFQARKSWELLEPRSNLAVVSDFAGANEFLGREFLNMADRRNLPYRIAPKRAAARGFHGPPSTILYLDEQAPDPDVAGTMKQVTLGGTMLIASRQSGAAEWGEAPVDSPIPGYECRSLGKGRIAVPAKAWDDPYVLASEVRILMGRRSDVVRLFNTGSMAALYARDGDRKSGIIHLLNYTLRAGAHPVSVAPEDDYQRAQVVTLDRPARESLNLARRSKSFSEVAVPAFTIYTAVELTGSKEG